MNPRGGDAVWAGSFEPTGRRSAGGGGWAGVRRLVRAAPSGDACFYRAFPIGDADASRRRARQLRRFTDLRVGR